MTFKLNRDLLVISSMVVVFFTLVFFLNFFSNVKDDTQFSHEEYVYLTRSLLQNRLDIDYPNTDYIFYNNKFYWHLGLFPSILIMPLVTFFEQFLNLEFKQGYIQFFITLAIFLLAFKLSRKKRYDFSDSVLLAFSFVFSSVYIFNALTTWSWYFLQTVTVLFSFLSIYEYYGKKRWWLISLTIAILFMSRPTSALIIIFYLLSILFEKTQTFKKRLKNLFILFFAPSLAIVFLLLYNYARFENPLNSGYTLTNNWNYTEEQRFELTNYGLFNFKNIPSNFYYYFLNGLDPVLLNRGYKFILKPPFVKAGFPGTSFFVVSPIFLYVFKLREKSKENIFYIISIIITLLILLTYYWPGWLQLGPRYTLDFLPMLYILLLASFKDKKVSNIAKILIFFSAFLNIYLYSSLFH